MSKSTSDVQWLSAAGSNWIFLDSDESIDLVINIQTYHIERMSTAEGTVEAGPFESLEAAKAAYLVMKGAYGG